MYYYVLSGGCHPFGDQYRRQANILAGEYELETIINSECKYLSLFAASGVISISEFVRRNVYHWGRGKGWSLDWKCTSNGINFAVFMFFFHFSIILRLLFFCSSDRSKRSYKDDVKS